MAAAHNAWWSELLPSVAETSVCESRVKVYGSEPLWRTSASLLRLARDPAP